MLVAAIIIDFGTQTPLQNARISIAGRVLCIFKHYTRLTLGMVEVQVQPTIAT